MIRSVPGTEVSLRRDIALAGDRPVWKDETLAMKQDKKLVSATWGQWQSFERFHTPLRGTIVPHVRCEWQHAPQAVRASRSKSRIYQSVARSTRGYHNGLFIRLTHYVAINLAARDESEQRRGCDIVCRPPGVISQLRVPCILSTSIPYLGNHPCAV